MIAPRHTLFPFLSTKSYFDSFGNRGAGQLGNLPKKTFRSDIAVYNGFDALSGAGYDALSLLIVGSLAASVPADASSVASDNAGSTASGDNSNGLNSILNGISSFTSSLGLLSVLQQAIEPNPTENVPEAENLDSENPLEPIIDPEPIRAPWIYNLMNPGPLDASIARNFAGGQYSPVVVGEEGWSFDGVYRVFGGRADETGYDGTYYSPLPQVGGLQSKIDLGLRPEWGNTATDVVCVYLAPGTQAYIGPTASQTGYSPTVPGSGQSLGGIGIQIYVPRTP